MAGIVIGRVGRRVLPDPQREAFLASARRLADAAQARADARLRAQPLHTARTGPSSVAPSSPPGRSSVPLAGDVDEGAEEDYDG